MWCVAIEVKKNSGAGNAVTIVLDNGHYQALQNIQKSYRIKNVEETLSFMLAVAEKTESKGVIIGEQVYRPSKEIRVG